jgi:adenine-specific DNA glycosylase
MAKRVILSVTNDLSNDQRVHRVATALMEMGFEVCLGGSPAAQIASLGSPALFHATPTLPF